MLTNVTNFDQLNGVLSNMTPVLSGIESMFGAALPDVLKNLLTKGPSVAEAGGAAAVSTVAGAGGACGASAAALLTAAATLPAALAGGFLLKQASDAAGAEGPTLRLYPETDNRPSFNVSVGDSHAEAALDQVLEAVKAQITAAWNAARKGTPVTGSMGGNYNTSNLAPR